MTRPESQAYECGQQLAERWGITIDEAALWLIRNDYWEAIHKPWKKTK